MSEVVQQQSAAAAPPRTDLIRPPRSSELRQRPLSAVLSLNGKERTHSVIQGATSVSNQFDVAELGRIGSTRRRAQSAKTCAPHVWLTRERDTNQGGLNTMQVDGQPTSVVLCPRLPGSQAARQR